IAAHRTTALHGLAVNAGCAFCVAAHSTAKPSICARWRASDTIPTFAISRTDFGWYGVFFGSVGGVVAASRSRTKWWSVALNPGVMMEVFVPVTITAARAAFIIAVGFAATMPAHAEPSSQPVPQVAVVRATNGCFSSSIRVTGFLVPREEAVVTLDAPGMTVTEVWAGGGDRATAGQTLARLPRDGPDTGAAKTATLKAPAAGVITRSTAVVGATASPLTPEPLFRIAVD